MINLLVPTDFSDLSKVAIRYAIGFANKINAGVTLLHVVKMVSPPRASARLKMKALEQDLMDTAREDIDKLAEEFRPMLKEGLMLTTRASKGQDYSEQIKKEARRHRSALIIMGTRGASGIKKYVVGSNTASVIELSQVPVLAVPELGIFKDLGNVVYATDLKHTEKELRIIVPFLQRFDSIVHLVHVASSARQVPAIEKKIDAIVEKTGFRNVVVRVMVHKNVDEAIDQYVTGIKADLLSTFTTEHGFYDKLFNRSITRKIAFQSKIPLLAFKQKRSMKSLILALEKEPSSAA
jgi:nucleotide-binding universal stress UspA family protein